LSYQQVIHKAKMPLGVSFLSILSGDWSQMGVFIWYKSLSELIIKTNSEFVRFLYFSFLNCALKHWLKNSRV
jgi:hypothetical protein